MSPISLTLSSAQTDTATFTVNPPEGTSPATYTAALTADHPNGELDGSDSASIHVVAPLTDIAITSVSGPANAEVGSSVNVNVTVQNVGNQDVTSNIGVTLVDTTDGPTIGSQTIAGGLAPGSSTTLTFAWNTSGASSPADHTLTASHNLSDENSSNDSGGTQVAVNDSLGITSFSPAFVKKGTSVPVSITGSGFLADATVQFLNGGGPNPSASNVVVVDSNTITAMVNAPGGGGKRDRQWDARVNSGGASTTLANAVILTNNPPANTAPAVSISSPSNGSTYNMSDSVSFAATATDAEDGGMTSLIAWTSNLDGSIGSGGGTSTTLSPGTHTITASVTDTGGMTGSDTLTVNIQNDTPTVSISGPANGSSFPEGTSMSFAGTANDTEDGSLTANLSWTSSIDGAIGSGGSFSHTLNGGSHTITASVTDAGGGTGSDSVTVTITVSNNAPTVSISSPGGGSTFSSSANIAFAGSASDVEDGNVTRGIIWTSSINGAIGSGAGLSTSSLSEGSHTITASVTDSGTKSGTDTVNITVQDFAPSVSISSPANGSSFPAGTSVSFSGSASDTEDGDLTGSLNWTSSLDGGIGSGGSPSFGLSAGTHTITASVTDSGTNSSSASITVTVNGSIVLSANGYKVKGRHRIDLTWAGANGTNVEIRQDGALLTTTANDGAYTDATNNRGGRTYVYQTCETGGGPCSNTATVTF